MRTICVIIKRDVRENNSLIKILEKKFACDAYFIFLNANETELYVKCFDEDAGAIERVLSSLV